MVDFNSWHISIFRSPLVALFFRSSGATARSRLFQALRRCLQLPRGRQSRYRQRSGAAAERWSWRPQRQSAAALCPLCRIERSMAFRISGAGAPMPPTPGTNWLKQCLLNRTKKTVSKRPPCLQPVPLRSIPPTSTARVQGRCRRA